MATQPTRHLALDRKWSWDRTEVPGFQSPPLLSPTKPHTLLEPRHNPLLCPQRCHCPFPVTLAPSLFQISSMTLQWCRNIPAWTLAMQGTRERSHGLGTRSPAVAAARGWTVTAIGVTWTLVRNNAPEQGEYLSILTVSLPCCNLAVSRAKTGLRQEGGGKRARREAFSSPTPQHHSQ